MAGRGDETCATGEHARRTPGALDEKRAIRAAAILSAAGALPRLRLLVVLAEGPRDVTSLAACVGAHHATVSHHLSTLRDADLVRTTRRGRRIVYALADAHAVELVSAALAFAALPSATTRRR